MPKEPKPPPIDVDGNWKTLIQREFTDFLQFFMPKIFKLLDFTRKIDFLEQEMRGLNRGAKGKRLVDKLAKVPLLGGETVYILVHVEVQGQVQPDFDARMFEYGAMAYLKLKMPIEAIAIFVGSSKPTNQGTFTLSKIENQNTYQYKIYHVLDHSEEELWAMDNIFALAILANRYMLRTNFNSRERLELRKKIFLLAKKRDYATKKMIEIVTFAQQMLQINDNLKAEFKAFIQLENLAEIMGVAVKEKPRLEFLNLIHEIEHGVSYEEHMQEKEKKFHALVLKLHQDFKMTAQQIAEASEIDLTLIEQILKEKTAKKNGKK